MRQQQSRRPDSPIPSGSPIW
ncbi:hypothetical protein [Acidobacterium sp. S8]